MPGVVIQVQVRGTKNYNFNNNNKTNQCLHYIFCRGEKQMRCTVQYHKEMYSTVCEYRHTTKPEEV